MILVLYQKYFILRNIQEVANMRPLFLCMTGMSYIYGESPFGAQLPTNPIATCKFQTVTFGREEAIANSWPDEQKPNTKAHQADKLAQDSKVPKGNRKLDV